MPGVNAPARGRAPPPAHRRTLRDWPGGQSATLARVALVGPTPLLNSRPLAVMLADLRDERAATVPFPPGDTRVSLRRTRRFAEEPLPMLLDAYERFGPIFTMRLFHSNVVFMLGPAA